MESTSLNSQQNTNIFDKDVLIQKLWKNTKTIEELPYLKDIHSYQWFKNSLEENIENFELQNADNMTQLLIDEITDTIEREKNDRLIKFMQEKNITEIDEEFLKLPQEQRIVITKYRHESNKWENNSRDKNYWCGTYGYFKVDTTCFFCLTWWENLGKAWLRNLTEFCEIDKTQFQRKQLKKQISPYLQMMKKKK